MLMREVFSLVLFHILIILKEKMLDDYERFFYSVCNLRNTWKGMKISITRKKIILLLANHESTKSP